VIGDGDQRAIDGEGLVGFGWGWDSGFGSEFALDGQGEGLRRIVLCSSNRRGGRGCRSGQVDGEAVVACHGRSPLQEPCLVTPEK